MRIISGKYRGKRIVAPKRLPVRPTTDMAKEGLFNILNNRYFFNELNVLDLFTGTGNISYEFASRGVLHITAVDQNAHCVRFVAQTSASLGSEIKTVKSDALKFLHDTGQTLDIIFADPPYAFTAKECEKIVEAIFKKDLLSQDGLLIIEHAPQTDLCSLPHFQESRKYGSSVFSFFGWE